MKIKIFTKEFDEIEKAENIETAGNIEAEKKPGSSVN